MTGVLQRKVAHAQSDRPSSEVTALRALRLSLARSGDALFDLPLGVLGGRQARAVPDHIADMLSDDDLLMVLDCPGGMTGAVALSLPVVSSLIQQQTMCQVSDRPAEPRPYTDTDAAMCAPLIEDLLTRAHDLAEVEPDRSCFNNLRFGARGEDVRTVVLGLQAKRYRIFWLTLDIALGKHQGQMILVLPDAEEDPPQVEEPKSLDRETIATSPMLDVHVQMQAILVRLPMTLEKLNGLIVGDSLPIQRSQLDQTTLVSINGDVVARGRLGQMDGNRAVRLLGAQTVPRVEPDMVLNQDGFAPHAAALPPRPCPGEEDLPGAPTADAFEQDLDPDELATLSPSEAADHITELAGLTEEDLAMTMNESFDAESIAAEPLAIEPPPDA